MTKKKVFLSIVMWGADYTEIFVNYNLATQLSENNLPSLLKNYELTYHILTTKKDKEWLEQQSLIQKLNLICHIEWEFLEDYCPNGEDAPRGSGGEKYIFLSFLQNIAMKRALNSDILIFNYADFIWADGSIQHLVNKFNAPTDAVLTFCLPVDHQKGIDLIQEHASQTPNQEGIITLKPREATAIALNALHREAQLRFWDDKKFTITPTYILWPVDDEGIVITAYHQTILALRINPNNAFYHNGILTGSLDGFYSAVLAANGDITSGIDSDEIFVFSLYDTIVDSSIGGVSRSDWTHFSRETSMRECLKTVITEKQRNLIFAPIEVRKSYINKKRWNEVKTNACHTLKQFHNEIPFDADLYYKMCCNDALNCFQQGLSNVGNTSISNQKINYLTYVKKFLRKIFSKLHKIIIHLFLSNNVILNGNFTQWTRTCFTFTQGAWQSLPAKYWLGHFDLAAQGVFFQSVKTPNNLSAYSLGVEGIKDGATAYVAQKIPAAVMQQFMLSKKLFVSGYLYREGDIAESITLNLITPNKWNSYEHYTTIGQVFLDVKTQKDFIHVRYPHTWQYFEVVCNNINLKKNVVNGALVYFKINGLSSSESRLYLSQIKFESDYNPVFIPRTVYHEKIIQFKVNISNVILKPIHYVYTFFCSTKKSFRVVPKNNETLVCDTDNAVWMIEQNRTEELINLLAKEYVALSIDQQIILSPIAAAYYWLGTLPEKIMNQSADTDTLEKILFPAEKALTTLIKLAPFYLDGYRALAYNLKLQGKYSSAREQYCSLEKSRIEYAKSRHLDPFKFILLSNQYVENIHSMGYLDLIIKKKILMSDQRTYHLIVSEEVAHPDFFEYWKAFFSVTYPNIETVSHAAIKLAYTIGDGDNRFFSYEELPIAREMAHIQKSWQTREKGPLLVLNQKHTQEWEHFKSTLGMKETDWFVCIDVCSKKQLATNGGQYFRESPIEDYYPTIKAIIDAGGWVFRLGDNNEPLLAQNLLTYSNKIIDYSRIGNRQCALSMIICATCSLFVTSYPGLYGIAQAFGRRVCFVNVLYSGLRINSDEIFITMLYYSIAKHRLLSMEEILASNLIDADINYLLKKEKVVVLRNTSDEITQTVIEALEQEQLVPFNQVKKNSIREKFASLNITYDCFISGQLGSYFFEKYKNILFPTDNVTHKKMDKNRSDLIDS